MINLEPENVESFLQEGNKIKLVCFTATWCGPCVRFLPNFIELSQEKSFNEKFDFAIADVDLCTDLTETYNIMHIPTILGLKSFKIKFRTQRYKELSDLRDWLSQISYSYS